MSDAHDKDPDKDPDAPVTEEEARAAAELRDALGSDAVALALKAAWRPEGLAREEHGALLDALPSADELALAEELRVSLEAGRGRGPVVALALRAAWSPAGLTDAEHAEIVRRAVESAGGARVIPLQARGRARRFGVVTAAASTVLALAAGFLLWIQSSGSGRPVAIAPVALARARSTQPLFDEPFKAGETSARIDKIAMARTSDYRANLFTQWGVR